MNNSVDIIHYYKTKDGMIFSVSYINLDSVEGIFSRATIREALAMGIILEKGITHVFDDQTVTAH